jgi:hypothetical protein
MIYRVVLWLLVLSRGVWAFDCTGQPFIDCGGFNELNRPSCVADVCTYPTAPDTAGAGTISSSGATVTGSSSDFVNAINPGWIITAAGQNHIVSTIASATSLTMGDAFVPALAAGTAYTVRPPLGSWDFPDGTPMLHLTGDGRIGFRTRKPSGFIDLRSVTPASVSSGAGTSAMPYMIQVVGNPGGNTTASGSSGGAASQMSVILGVAGDSANATGTDGPAIVLTAGAGGRVASGSSKTAGLGGAITLTAGAGGDVVGSNTGGVGGSVNINAGNAGTSGTGGNNGGSVALNAGAGSGTGVAGDLLLANGTGGIKGGVNGISMPRLQSFSSTTDANLASTTDVEALTSSVLMQTGLTESYHVSVQISAQAGAARTYTCSLRTGGSSCTSGSTLITDSTATEVCGSAELHTLTWLVKAASLGTQTTTVRLCCKSTSATGTQTTTYQQLDVFEF